MHVGIDNGLDGGIVALSDLDGLPPIAMLTMPVYLRKRRAKGKNKKPKHERELDTPAFLHFLTEVCFVKNNPETIFHVEQAPRHAPGASPLRVMNFTYGKIIGILEAVFPLCPLKRIRCGTDNDGWQKALLGDLQKGETKPAAEGLARKLWPGETWLPTPKCTVPHTGLIDGALIAYFGRQHFKAK